MDITTALAIGSCVALCVGWMLLPQRLRSGSHRLPLAEAERERVDAVA